MPGILAVEATTLPTDSTATVAATGGLAQNSGDTLTAGHLQVDADARETANSIAILESPGARIDHIAAGAGITLTGQGALIRDRTTQADALTRLDSSAGFFRLEGKDLELEGGFHNEPTGLLEVDEATLILDGPLINESELTVENFARRSSLVAGGGLDNSGLLRLDASGPVALGSFSGPLAQQVDGVLVAGEFQLSTGGVLEYDQAALRVIGPEAAVSIGLDSIIRDRLTQLDALTPLAAVHGRLVLGDRRDRSTTGDLTVTGAFDFRHAGLTVTGGFFNSGRTRLNPPFSLNIPTTMTVEGAFSNSGELYVYPSASFTTTSPLDQQSGSELTAGEIYLIDGSAAWNGAAITRIGTDSAVGLAGPSASLRNSADDVDALTGLASNDGYFFLEEHEFTFAGDFHNTGETQLGPEVTLHLNPGATIRSSGRFENGGDTAISDGSLELHPGGFFGIFDYFTGFDPVTFEALYTLGTLRAPNLTLAGELEIFLTDLVPQSSDRFVLFESPNLTGTFSNVPFGERVPVYDGFDPDTKIGSFEIQFDPSSGTVSATGYQAMGAGPSVTITNLLHTGAQFQIDWIISDGSGADLYRSDGLIFSPPALRTNILTGTFTGPAPPPGRAFYLVLPTGTSP